MKPKSLLLVLAAGLTPVQAQQPSVPEPEDLMARLDYGTFRGAYSRAYNISYWQKIPFAAPPTGQNRFRGPQPVGAVGPKGSVYDSSQPFDMCPQRTVNGSEDCLYLGLYSRPWRAGLPLRPVVVAFYGGGNIRGSASFGIPPSLMPVVSVGGEEGGTTTDLVVIYPNYRTNGFGFLPGRQVAEDWPDSDLNVGLLDQRAAVRWASRHVRAFGGDPDQITVQGQSAGGGGVLSQAIGHDDGDGNEARGGRPLFRGAMANSPFWPKTYAHDDPEAQWIFDTYAERAGCGGPPPSGRGGGRGGGSGKNDTRLACLKAADVQALREAGEFVAASHTYGTSSYTWAPVIDGRFLRRPLSSFAGGGPRGGRGGDMPGIVPEAVFAMYNTHEGENFTPPAAQLATPEGFDAWLAGFLPRLDGADRDEVKAAYPAVGDTETIGRYEDGGTRAGLIYRDVVLACPAYWLAGVARKGGWLGEYSISPARHASDTYWWNTINAAQQTDRLHYEGYTGAMASFMSTGDPNARKLTNSSVPGVPALLDTGREFHVGPDGFGQLELTRFRERCELWRRLAPKVPM